MKRIYHYDFRVPLTRDNAQRLMMFIELAISTLLSSEIESGGHYLEKGGDDGEEETEPVSDSG